MRVFTGRADILLMINELIDRAERMGCRVVLTHDRRISFHPDMAIHIPPVADEATLYALAHEVGHLIDYLAGTLDYNMWKNNQSYRINAEMKAWVNGYTLLAEIGAPLGGWRQHVKKMLTTYLDYTEVSSFLPDSSP